MCCAAHVWPNERAKRLRKWGGRVRSEPERGGGGTGAPMVAYLEDASSACGMDAGGDLGGPDWVPDEMHYVPGEDRWDLDLSTAEPWAADD